MLICCFGVKEVTFSSSEAPSSDEEHAPDIQEFSDGEYVPDSLPNTDDGSEESLSHSSWLPYSKMASAFSKFDTKGKSVQQPSQSSPKKDMVRDHSFSAQDLICAEAL